MEEGRWLLFMFPCALGNAGPGATETLAAATAGASPWSSTATPMPGPASALAGRTTSLCAWLAATSISSSNPQIARKSSSLLPKASLESTPPVAAEDEEEEELNEIVDEAEAEAEGEVEAEEEDVALLANEESVEPVEVEGAVDAASDTAALALLLDAPAWLGHD